MDPLSLPPLADRPARVLVASDDAWVARALMEALGASGTVVLEADPLESIVDLARRMLPDLVLLDTCFDGGSALEVLGDLRMLDPLRLMPIVLFSPTVVDEDDVVRALLAGADDHVAGLGRMRELVARVGVQLRNRRDRDLLRTAQKERVRLIDATLTDPLTGLGNRRAADDALAHLLVESETALLMVVDVDHFKRVNDTYGHAAGDDVLRALGRCLSKLARDGDTIARFGGEEFLVLIRGAPRRTHRGIAERFLRGVRAMRLAGGVGPCRITASIGAASWAREAWVTKESPARSRPPPDWDQEPGGRSLFVLADRALYQAKRSGRDAIVLFDAEAASAADGELVLAPSTENAS